MTDYRYRWVSTRVFKPQRDDTNPQQGWHVDHAVRQGWELVPEGEEPKHLTDEPMRFNTFEMQPILDPAKGFGPDMRLYRMPEEKAVDRSAYYARLAAEQLTNVQDRWLASGHALMPTFVGEDRDFYPEPEDAEGKIAWARNKALAEELDRESWNRRYGPKSEPSK